MEECNTGITITQTAEECAGNYLSTNCVATPNAITYLDLSAGASQTQINAAITSALMRKDEQISEIPIADGSETKIVGGTNVTVTGSGTNLSNYVISAVSNTGSLEFNILDRTVWNNGKSDIETNTTFGELSLSSNTIGDENVSIGHRSMMVNTEGDENVSIGSSSMFSNTTGDLNVSVGADAMFRNTTGFCNVAVGASSFFSNTTGNNNTAIGFEPLLSNTLGYSNTAVGYRALSNVTAGNTNTAIGSSAGARAQGFVSNTGAIESVYIGANTSPLNNNETNQIVIGYGALGAGSNTVTLGNTSIIQTVLRGEITAGSSILSPNLTGTPTAPTPTAGSAGTQIANKDYVLANAGSTGILEFNNTDLTVWNNGKGNISTNTTFGESSLKTNTTGFSNVSVGKNSLRDNTTGRRNVAIGDESMTFNTTGYNNSAIGNLSLQNNTTGDSNSAVGISALSSNTEGYSNTSMGNSSLTNNTTGGNNTAFGDNTLGFNTTGNRNTGLGAEASALNTTGENNTSIGRSALYNNFTGNNNTAIGIDSGRFTATEESLVTTNNSVFLGSNTRSSLDNSNNEIVIGTDAIGSGTNTVTLGNTLITKTILRGTINVGNLLIFADNSAAITGGLIVGDMYRTSTGDLKVRF